MLLTKINTWCRTFIIFCFCVLNLVSNFFLFPKRQSVHHASTLTAKMRRNITRWVKWLLYRHKQRAWLQSAAKMSTHYQGGHNLIEWPPPMLSLILLQFYYNDTPGFLLFYNTERGRRVFWRATLSGWWEYTLAFPDLYLLFSKIIFEICRSLRRHRNVDIFCIVVAQHYLDRRELPEA